MATTPYVKICGLSTADTVDRAVTEGANALGFVFAPNSPRTITPEEARDLVARVPDGVETVGVFRRQSIDEVLDIATSAGVSSIQFHGGEPLSDLHRARDAGFNPLRAFSIAEYLALTEDERAAWAEERILIDAVEPGSGVPFDPALLGSARPAGWWMLAGGLTPQNVGPLIEQLQPSGVDVSSGVESSRGTKSPDLITVFIRATSESL